jgi:DNA-binding MarR family transcriptional regulator
MVWRSRRLHADVSATCSHCGVLAVLLNVGSAGRTVSEYARVLGTSQSLMTRHLADLGEINRYHETGYDLIEARTDPMDRRAKRNQLTAKGQRLVGQILGALTR